MAEKIRILTIADHYLPAYKAGGAVRTLANMVDRLGEEFSFLVMTGERDLDDEQPYPGIELNRWLESHRCRVIYLSPPKRSFRHLKRLLNGTAYDLIYLNSFFSTLTIKILLLRRLGMLPKVPVVIAPRGEFSPGALTLKRRKKLLYIYVSRLLGLYHNLAWQASSEHEKEHIGKYFRGKVFVAPDLPPASVNQDLPEKRKEPGKAEFVFVSRISRKKNIHYALKLFNQLDGEAVFHIYGPEEDPVYTAECLEMKNELPGNIDCQFYGSIPHEEVYNVFKRYHFFLFPTLGENFGHVILEALSAGCPVITSDRTPWEKLLEKDAGWDIPLENETEFIAVLKECISMEDNRYQVLSRGAREMGRLFSNDGAVLEQNKELFFRCLEKNGLSGGE